MFGSKLPALLAVTAVLAACEDNDGKPTQSMPEPAPGEVDAVPKWVTKDPGAWPQLVLTNAARFEGHSPLRGASGFLVRNSKSEVFYATALHLLGANGGVRPDVEEAKLDSVFNNWSVYPRTNPNDQIQLAGLAGAPNGDPESDWVILRLAEPARTLPAEPLLLRRTPVVVGEKVYLIGVPYSEKDRAQNVYIGEVTERKFGDRFRYDLDPPVDIRGFSGAPILDVEGHVVGVMTVWFDAKMEGELFLEAGGQDAAAVVDRVEAGQR